MARPVYMPGTPHAKAHRQVAREMGLTERQAAVIEDLAYRGPRTLRLHEAMSLTKATAPFIQTYGRSGPGQQFAYATTIAGRSLGIQIRERRRELVHEMTVMGDEG